MASAAIRNDRQDCESRTTSKSASTSGSESSSTEEEERLRRLFLTCDRDKDGFIDSQDLAMMCRQLNMEDAVEEIMVQLGADDSGRISFDEFLQCRMRLITEIEQERLKERGLVSMHPGLSHWPIASNTLSNTMHGRSETLDLDSNNLYKLMEEHDPEALQRMVEIADTLQGEQGGSNFLDVANSLHLAALTSLKGEILDLSNRLQHVTTEKEVLEKQLNKQQSERLRIQRDAEDKLEQTTSRYEERITELHSVIAELRKKIDRNQINVIREEEEFEGESVGKSEERSNGDCASLNENNANESRSESVADITNDLNVELSRVVCELESALERKPLPLEAFTETVTPNRTAVNEKTMQVPMSNDRERATPPVPPRTTEIHRIESEMLAVREDNTELQLQVGRQETELNKLRAQTGSIREERDRLKRKVRELQTRLQSIEASSSPNSRTSTPTKSQAINPTTGERTISVSSTEQAVTPPVAKIAGMRKLKTGGPDRLVLGAEISSVGLPNAKVAEHLVQNLQECSNIQEISQNLSQSGNQVSDSKIKDFEVELERLTSKIDHLKSQNDLLTLTLEESKAHCDRLTVLIGKYESNNTALQLAISFSDQALEAYEVMVTLLDSEQGVLLANCRAAGLGSNIGNGECEDDQEEVTGILQKAHLARKGAEHSAKQLLHRLERSLTGVHIPGSTPSPWEDLSSNSHTTSTTSSTASSSDTEFSKVDEQKLRDHIQQLKNDRAAVKMTVMELESVHIDPLSSDLGINPDAQRLDLENAVLMQELMAMKEEKAELKSQNYLLNKEKSALELQLSGKQSQEQAYMVQIDHLKCELSEQLKRYTQNNKKQEDGPPDALTPAITLAELRSHDSSQIAQDLTEALKREKRLKARVQELMVSLEKISKNADIRHQQSAEFVNDLKRANCALITAFEKSKKKYQGKMKRMEAQLQAMVERYETQIHALQQEVLSLQKESSRPPTNETSL